MFVSVILVNYNGRHFILDCIKGVFENPPSIPYEIIVVDNASPDGSAKWMQSDDFLQQIPSTVHFRLIANDSNDGFGKANNIGFNNSTSDFVFVLNSDAIVTAGAIDKLIAPFHMDPDIMMTGPKIIDEDGTHINSVWVTKTNPWKLFISTLSLQRFFNKEYIKKLFYKNGDSTVSCPVGIISGAGMMVKRVTIDTIGGFDEDFFMYGEDLEWCDRISMAKKKIFYVPDAIIIHSGGKSTEKSWDDMARQKKIVEGGILHQKKTARSVLYRANMLTLSFCFFVIYISRYLLFKKPVPSFYFKRYFKAFLS